ncbi:hypothetical protein GCM10011396_09850 [Undibacterium terreum]|uniref:Uncharacterized protein n=1 Tax=Undibacterium terreum TaxID=1224302 RepID=A0A916XD04_9BURK|nr:hypothetical protein GCM10011396_09850 [Undibacterium terreum]
MNSLPPEKASTADSDSIASKLGPGLITGADDDDPRGIANNSQGGAQFAYKLLWAVLLVGILRKY